MVDYEQAIFISYAWGGESEEIVNHIDQALQVRGLTIIRDKRDLGYKGSISAFMERIGQGNCVIVVISDKYLRSSNCMFELVEIAEGKEFHDRVFPIVLSNAEIYDPVRRLQYVKHWEDKLAELDQAIREVKSQANLQGVREDIDQYSRIRDKVSGLTSILKDMNTLTPKTHRDSDFSEIYDGIERRMAEASGQIEPESGESPYMGLRYFDTTDAALFYGREALTRELVERVAKESFLAIVGASGSGKSSVARAGLIPAWEKENEKGVVHVITPTAHPLESLAASLTHESESFSATLQDLQQDTRGLRLRVRRLLKNSGQTNFLLVVDQFEETFTLCKDLSERKAFIENLLTLVDEENNTARVVITLRADFYHHCAEYEGLRLALEKYQAYIGPMTQDELREAITQPAEVNSWDFRPGLVELILKDVGAEPGALPLLSHALLETWKRRQGRMLTLQGYHEAGGVKEAVTQTAESVYDKLTKDEQAIAREIFLRLTELGEGTQDTRRRVKMDELGQTKEHDTVAKVLKTLTDARLVTTEQDSAEVAHEALIREWDTLRKWLDEDRESLRLYRQLTESTAEWERSNKDDTFLVHRGGRLDDALTLKTNSFLGLSTSEESYLVACVELGNREQRERERRSRITIIASIAAAVIFLVLGSFGLVKSSEASSRANEALTAQADAQNKQLLAVNNAATAAANEQEAIRQAQIAFARQLASQAQLVNTGRSSNQMTATLLAIQSMKLFQNGDAARYLLNNNLSAFQISRMTHDSPVYSVAFSPDGKYVVSRSADGTKRIWEAATGIEVAYMIHDGPVYSLAFSPDSKYVVSSSRGSPTARVWEAATGKEIARMTHDNSVSSVAFSPDGKYVVSVSAETARVWEAATGIEVARMTHDDTVNSIAFSPDGKYVVSSSRDSPTARVWEAATGKEVAHMTHDGNVASIEDTSLILPGSVNSVAFSPDGKYVVSGSDDGTARVWEAATGIEVARMTHDGYVLSTGLTFTGDVTSVAFSPDGKYVVSGSNDNTARVWEAATGIEVARITHDDTVNSIAFSPDGEYVVSGSDDNTARIWLAATGEEVARMTHDNSVNSVAFSPDGKYVVSGNDDNTARVWKAARMTHDSWVNSIAFSPDGKYVVSGSDDDTARVWETATGVEVARMTHDNSVTSVAFSPDGKYVVSGSSDGTARVWQAATGKEIARLRLAPNDEVFSVAFSPDGKYVVSGLWSNVLIWEATTGIEVTRLNYPIAGIIFPVNSVAFSLDGKYVVSSDADEAARVWEATTGIEVARMTHDDALAALPGDIGVNSASFSPDGKYVVSSSRGSPTARVWEATTGKEVARMTHDSWVNSIAFSPDGEYVVSGSSDNTARVWEATTGKEVARMTHDSWVNSVAFSPDGKYVVSGSADNTARVWETATGVEVARISHDDSVLTVAFSPDGKYVVSGSADHTIRVWVWQAEDLIANACAVMPRNLTHDQWKQYIGDVLPYQAVCENLPIEPKVTATP